MGQRTTGGPERGFPIIQHWLHSAINIPARCVVVGTSLEQLGVVNEIGTDELDGFVTQGAPHVQSKPFDFIIFTMTETATVLPAIAAALP